MIQIRAKKGRPSKQLPPLSCNPGPKSSSLIIPSAANVASSEDLLFQILLHVPLKPLTSFKSVSKHWLSLITSPHFVRLRGTFYPSPSSLFFRVPCPWRSRTTPEYRFISLDVAGECLIPFKTLDFIPEYCSAREIYSPFYKVVCLRRSEKSRQLFQIEIYSSETLSWRASGEPFTAPKHTEFQNSIYWNGSVHWWNGSFHWWNGFTNHGCWRMDTHTLYFKVDEESLKQLPIPKKQYAYYHVASYVGESEGHLYLVEGDSDFNRLFKVYELARDFSGWFMKYQVDMSEVTNVFPEMMKKNPFHGYTLKIISLVRKEKEEKDGSFLVLEIPGGQIIHYNLVDKSVKKLWEFPPGHKFYNDNCLRHVLALSYIESLACV
ncbi:hypothetical protein DCAR_0520703 [Daucus carota subsp. sativus]|uniref:F-box domain-containing protein n=1 Tax=Daucus carota subsp. sativus TaxID=79200 RepID=A0AAF0X7L4_DAUCS|nr:hypothetical protein DCAR_0520703 [Daucus carota subsp. sativus]